MTLRRSLLVALLLAVAAFGVFAVRLYAESANSDFKQGQAAEAREDYDAAFELYQKAYNRDPKDARFKIALARIRTTASAMHVTKGRKLLQAGDEQGALAEFLHASEIDPGNEAAQQEIAHCARSKAPVLRFRGRIARTRRRDSRNWTSRSAPELKPVSNEPLSLHMTEDAKVVYQAIGKAAGVNVLFDPDYNSKRIQVDLNNVSLLDALRIVGAMSNTFWRPVTSNTIFVAQNSRIKRHELDEQAVQTFYLTNAWQQNDLNDVQTALRNVLTNAKVYGVQARTPSSCAERPTSSCSRSSSSTISTRPAAKSSSTSPSSKSARTGSGPWASPGPAASASPCSPTARRQTRAVPPPTPHSGSHQHG